MNEIMLTTDNILPIETENKIVALERELINIKETEKKLKEALLEEMQKRNIKKIETEKLTITLIDESTRETFDTKSFREKYRDLYDEYANITPTKAYVKIGVL